MPQEILDKNMAKMEKMLAVMDGDTLTRSEFVSSFEKVVDLVLKIQKQQAEAISKLEETYANLIEKMQKEHTSGLADLKGQVDSVFVGQQIDKMREEHRQMMSAMEDKMASIKNGKDGHTPIKGVDYFDGRDGYRMVIDENTTKTISYLMEQDKISKNKKGETPSKFLGGVLQVGVRLETPIGTVNGVNTEFSFFKQPKWICVDGINYFEGEGYNILSGKRFTTTVPPTGFIKSFY